MVPDHWSNDAMVSMDRCGLATNLTAKLAQQGLTKILEVSLLPHKNLFPLPYEMRGYWNQLSSLVLSPEVLSPEMLAPEFGGVYLCKFELMCSGAARRENAMWGNWRGEFWFHFPFLILSTIFLFFCQLYFSCSKIAFFNSCPVYLKCNLREMKMRVVRGISLSIPLSPIQARARAGSPRPKQAPPPPSAPEVVSPSLPSSTLPHICWRELE